MVDRFVVGNAAVLIVVKIHVVVARRGRFGRGPFWWSL